MNLVAQNSLTCPSAASPSHPKAPPIPGLLLPAVALFYAREPFIRPIPQYRPPPFSIHPLRTLTDCGLVAIDGENRWGQRLPREECSSRQTKRLTRLSPFTPSFVPFSMTTTQHGHGQQRQTVWGQLFIIHSTFRPPHPFFLFEATIQQGCHSTLACS